MRTLFWGTPEFALPSLETLLSDRPGGCEVVGVVTQPPRPSGRGRRVRRSPAAQCAIRAGTRVLEPETLDAPGFLDEVKRLAPDVSVVVAYGRILSAELLDLPRLGSFNLHASLLPALRGAAPIPWAIARGHSQSGVSVIRMVEQMDAGPVVAQESAEILDSDTGAALSARLAKRGARLLTSALARIADGEPEEVEQDEAAATFAPKLTRLSSRVDWRRGARDVANLVRAMDAAPGAWTLLRAAPVKVFRPCVAEGSGHPGAVLRANPREPLIVAAGDGAVRLDEVQPPGKRRMPAPAWIAGRGVRPGDRFE